MGNLCSNSSAAAATVVETKSNAIRNVVHKDINIAEFLSVCIFLSEECGKIIRRVEESGEL